MRERIRAFINNELSAMGDNIVAGSNKNLENRQYNIFHGFSRLGKEIVKYMALGRSFDSQLGNRLQRIAMFIARLNYGVENVPNYLYLKADKVNRKVIVWKFSLPDELDIRHGEIGFNVYTTQCYYKANSKDDCLNQIMKGHMETLKAIIKERFNLTSLRGGNKQILEREIEKYKRSFESSIIELSYDCDNEEILTHIDNIPKIIPVDLLYFSDNSSISLYEIKAGGDLDSKNCETNADEVLENLKCFSFMDNCYSYFAACYNNRGEGGENTYSADDGVIYCGQRPVGGIFNIYEKIDRRTGTRKWLDMRNRILVGSKFWEKILPEDISFGEFMQIYKEEFEATNIEQKLKDIHYE